MHTNARLKNEDLKFGLLDVDKYNSIFEKNYINEYTCNNNKITLKLESEGDGEKVFLPVNYDKKFKVLVNGKQVNADNVLDGLISIDLEKGVNNIEMSIEDKLFKIGGIVSGITAVLMGFFIIYGKKIFKNKYIQNITYVCFIGTTIVFYMVIYVGGVVYSFLL